MDGFREALSAHPYSDAEIVDMELFIMKVLQFRMNVPTADEIAELIIYSNLPETESETLAYYSSIYIEFCRIDYELNAFEPSIMAMAAILCACEKAEEAAFQKHLIDIFSVSPLFDIVRCGSSQS